MQAISSNAFDSELRLGINHSYQKIYIKSVGFFEKESTNHKNGLLSPKTYRLADRLANYAYSKNRGGL